MFDFLCKVYMCMIVQYNNRVVLSHKYIFGLSQDPFQPEHIKHMSTVMLPDNMLPSTLLFKFSLTCWPNPNNHNTPAKAINSIYFSTLNLSSPPKQKPSLLFSWPLQPLYFHTMSARFSRKLNRIFFQCVDQGCSQPKARGSNCLLHQRCT